MTTTEHGCPCGEATETMTQFELDGEQWVEFNHGLVIHRFAKDADGLIKIGPEAPTDEGV